MKNLLIMILLFISTIAKADQLPDPSTHHSVTYNREITNINDYPNLTILGYVKNFIGNDYLYEIKQNTPIIKGYKFNSLYILAINKALFDSYSAQATTSGTDTVYEDHPIAPSLLQFIENKNISRISMTLGAGYMLNTYDVSSDSYFYKITSVTDNNVTLKLDKRVIKFTDGTQKTITY